jgi:O-antigen/teichoic acid export membrane protein
MGLDAGFFRVHYDCPSEAEKRRLAGTVALFAAGAGGALFGAVWLLAPWLARALFHESPAPPLFLVLVAADVYAGTFAFVPLSLLRIQDRPGLFSTLSALRHAVNTLLKVVLVVRGWGVAGILWSDLLATVFFSLCLLPVLLKSASIGFSRPLLAEVLRFGAPKVPHGLLVQVQNLADRKILDLFLSRAEVGLYQVGYTFGSSVKFATSAFEPAWQPFVYSQLGKPGAPLTLARTVTHAFSVFVAAALALAVLGGELLRLMTPSNPEFRAGAAVIPVVALAYLLHGAFLLTSVGIGIAKQARYYPIVTAAAASANVLANVALIPLYGIVGAAWATVLSYGVMAALGHLFSRRLYPIPFEWDRLARLLCCAAVAYALSLLAPSVVGLALVAKTVALAVFPAALLLSGFLRPEERPR